MRDKVTVKTVSTDHGFSRSQSRCAVGLENILVENQLVENLLVENLLVASASVHLSARKFYRL